MCDYHERRIGCSAWQARNSVLRIHACNDDDDDDADDDDGSQGLPVLTSGNAKPADCGRNKWLLSFVGLINIGRIQGGFGEACVATGVGSRLFRMVTVGWR